MAGCPSIARGGIWHDCYPAVIGLRFVASMSRPGSQYRVTDVVHLLPYNMTWTVLGGWGGGGGSRKATVISVTAAVTR